MTPKMSHRIKRLLKPSKSNSFFLFGPRGSGKTTLISDVFNKNSLFINLLHIEEEDRFRKNSDELISIVNSLPEKNKYIIIDEIQKVPKLLDAIHYLIEKTNKVFILTGSSARKLKHGGANLLAGRAFVYNLFPFTSIELGDFFLLQEVLEYGSLPKILQCKNNEEKKRFLQAYSLTFLKEEIWAERFIKDLDPFRSFLEVAAQMNGKILNFSKISSDVGVDDKTIKKYYSILEDTLLGFFLPGFKHSFRKRLNTKPKFYFFDTGIKRALSRTLNVPIIESTSSYGEAFEHFIILECIKLSSYSNNEYRFSYLMTKDGAEVDLIVERPGKKPLFIEIKSSKLVTKEALKPLINLSKDFKDCEAICLSNDKYKKKFDSVKVFPWQEGLKYYFLNS